MTRINYITNLDVNNFSGGWSGMNHHVYQQLFERFDVHLVDKVDPPYFLSDKILSKAFRVAGLKGIFPAFTRRRLDKIKKQVEERTENNRQLNFYHGSTPWLYIENKLPYALYLDCCFGSYIRVYHDQQQFSASQINELLVKEAEFLSKAKCVFFSSKWALDDATACYGLKGDNFFVAGLGGALELDDGRSEKHDPYFLFVGLDFLGKGGDKVVEAFNVVQKEYPEYKLKIAGQEPPEKYRTAFNVEYEGLLNKSEKTDLRKLIGLFVNAFCFVLPTSKDMTPLVLVEASGMGCPVITTNSFGIPEIIRHNETGLLLNTSKPLHDQLVSAMKEMIQNKALRQKFIGSAPAFIKEHFTWERTGKVIGDKLFESFPPWTPLQ